MQNEIVVQEATPATLLNIAINQGADLDRLEKLMALQERWEANQAKKAYYEAMTAFKADPPDIEKDRKVSYKTSTGTTAYSHASLWNVTDKINASLNKHGLSASWVTQQNDKGVTVTCRVSHILGHSEETSLTAAVDSSGGKNTIQALGSTITYLQRYTILALTGLATHEDDDGAGSEPLEFLSEEQLNTIRGFVQAKGVSAEKFLAYMGVETDSVILAKDYNKAMAALRSAKGKQ